MNKALSLAALGGILLLAGCTTTVSGNGSIDSNAALPQPSVSESPGDEQGERQDLSCNGDRVVSPDGAPYCYVVPSGLREIEDVVLPGGGEFTTAVGFGGRDIIAVTMFRTPANTDDLDNDTLQEATDQVVQQQLSRDFSFTSDTGERLIVDGARTLHYHGKSKHDAVDIDFYFVYRGRAKLQVNCQFTTHEAEITQACQELLDTLQFKLVD